MEHDRKKQLVEALILAAGEPISAAKLADIVPHLKPARARELVADLSREYEEQGRGFEIWEVAGGYQLRTRPELAPYVRQLLKERPLRLSKAAIETLSVVAYKQPVTRAEVEHVRGVDAGPMLRSLVERGLVKIAGHREVPGRPMLYGTTKRFLETFGLRRLEDLPTLREIDELLPAGEASSEDEVASGSETEAASGGEAEEGAAAAAAEIGDVETAQAEAEAAGELH